MVEVEQGSLSALEDHRAAGVERVPEDVGGVGDERLDPVPVAQVLLGHRVEVEAWVLGEWPQHQLLRLQRRHDLLAQDLRVQQVLDPDPEARRLVRVAGADAALCGPDLELAQPRLAGRVEHHVVGHDQVGVGGDPQAAGVDAAAAQALQLLDQHRRVDHHPIADHARLARVEDPGRDQVELELVAVADDRVAGVVAALEARHDVGLLGEQVGELSLALVAPLGAHDHDSGHDRGIMRYGAPGSAGRSGASAGRTRPLGARGLEHVGDRAAHADLADRGLHPLDLDSLQLLGDEVGRQLD